MKHEPLEEYADKMAVAIIGMAGRFPRADNPDDFWANVRDGVECVHDFTDEDFLQMGLNPLLKRNPFYVPTAGVIKGIEEFDAEFFGINPREAEVLDPQHRLFLECAVEAMENAGHDLTTFDGLVGIYAGSAVSRYALYNLVVNDEVPGDSMFNAALGNMQDTLATRVAYKLNLKGPTYAVQTNCSTSLVATHIATQALLNGECDMALAGGVFLSLQPGYIHTEGGITSPDGRCRAFDAKAEGAPFGDGVAIILLRRLEDAIEDGDNIRALILGSAINNDGGRKVGYTAPSVEGQYEVIVEALENADVHPETISFVEAHGSGTDLGDPIEIEALTRAFRAKTDKKGFCAVSSVKPNLGHLDRAAGTANLIAAVQALQHRQIPPCLYFETPNPKIDFVNSPFYVSSKLSDWQGGETPRRAGVTGLGIGGTNAHVILEEAPELPSSSPSRPWQLLALSAKTPTALDKATYRIADYFNENPDASLPDVAFTLQTGRTAFDFRRILVCRDIVDASHALDAFDPRRLLGGVVDSDDRSVVFMFSGLGDQYTGMGLEIYQQEDVFRESIDICAELLKPILSVDIRTILYPQGTDSLSESLPHTKVETDTLDFRQMLGNQENDKHIEANLLKTSLIHPIMFAFEYAIAQQWIAWGIRPQAMTGYSIGEFVAACLAGILSLEDAIVLVAKRALLIESLPPGRMLAVPIGEEAIKDYLSEDLSLSAVNGPLMSVVAGPPQSIQELERRLDESGLICRRLQTRHAFHSSMMEQIADAFEEEVRSVKLKAPQVPYASTVTGTWITVDEATNPMYWVRHLYSPVRFSDAVSTLWEDPYRILLEVGPGASLGSLALQARETASDQHIVLPSIRGRYEKQSDIAFLLATMGKLWLAGVAIDWKGFYTNEYRRRVPLPTYPFERRRYWIERPRELPGGVRLGSQIEVADWLYTPVWHQSAIPPAAWETGAGDTTYLIFVDRMAIGDGIANRLRAMGRSVITAMAGERFQKKSANSYVLNPARYEDYRALFSDLRKSSGIPHRVIHCWALTPIDDSPSRLHLVEQAQDLGFYSLLYVAQCISELDLERDFWIHAFSNNIFEIKGGDSRCPEKATVIGICKAIPKEYSRQKCALIEIDLNELGDDRKEMLIDEVMNDLAIEPEGEPIGYRLGRRWHQSFDAVRLGEGHLYAERLKKNRVYLITGGLGGLGLGLAEYLFRNFESRLVLTGRTAMLPKEQWDAWLAEHDEDDTMSYKIRQVRHLEELGAEVLTLAADVTDLDQMREAVDTARDHFGEINGVIHAAGLPGAGIISLKTREMADAVLAPKVSGTLVLDEVFRDEDLDFMMYYSSMTAITTGFGEVDYSAANNFLDAFAQYSHHARPYFTLAIDWPAWLWDAWQDQLLEGMPELQSMLRISRQIMGLSIEEGAQALTRALSSSFPQIVVTRRNLNLSIWRHKSWTMYNVMQNMSENENGGKKKAHPRPATLRNPYVEPSASLEHQITHIWQRLIGIDEIGVHDNFFELGGHSMLGTSLISKIRQAFEIELGLPVLYEAPTVAQMAEYVEKALAEKSVEVAAVG